MNTVALIQARMGSQRMPGKVIEDIAGRPLLAHVIDRVMRSRMVSRVAVATSIQLADSEVVAISDEAGVAWFRGSEEDVLDRFLGAARHFEADAVVRICGDCPLIDPGVIDEAVSLHLREGADYTDNCRLVKTFPRGLDVEVMNTDALEMAARDGQAPQDREHVTFYFYHSRPDRFQIALLEARGPLRRPELRLTVDVPEDLALMRAIYDRLYGAEGYVAAEQAIELLDREPMLAALNAGVQQKAVVPGRSY
jgi:spore coat polysaccharide biosynthesis protein SpsF (cytidylyltransferase family)